MNPIIHRELLEVLRTRKAVALQVGLAAVCALLVLVRWPTGDVADLSGTRPLQILRLFGYGLLAGILSTSGVFFSTGIALALVEAGGAAVAASFAAAGMGTDTCGSIRNPSSENSLWGLRGTIGLSSRDGIRSADDSRSARTIPRNG